MVRGVIVVFCVTALLFPVISMSDDLSQIPGLAESNRIQDILKAPELRAVYHLSAILPEVLLPLWPESSNLARNAGTEYSSSRYEMFWSPSVEKRPPPYA